MDEKQAEKDTRDVARFDSDLAAIQEIFGDRRGTEDLDPECFALPLLKLAQDMTDEARKGHAKYIPGLELGRFFSPTTGRIYGSDITLVPIKLYRNFMVYDGIDAKTSKFQGTITPAQFKVDVEPRAKQPIVDGKKKGFWVDSQGYRYVDARNFVVYNAEYPEDGQMLYTMSSTAIPVARQWTTMIESLTIPGAKPGDKPRIVPSWAVEWVIHTEFGSKNGYSYYQVIRASINRGNGRNGYVSKDWAPVFRAAFDRYEAVDASRINSEPDPVSPTDEPIFDSAPEARQPDPVRPEAKSEAVSAVQNTFGGFGPRKEPARHPDAKDVEPEIF